jgi:hypothetical protein
VVRRLAVLFDLLVVVIFVVIGRHAHHHAFSPAGLFRTFWPFAVGCLVGTLLHERTRIMSGVVLSGLFVGTVTVAVGMVLRVLSGQGTAFSFIVVALVFLNALMILWRSLAKRYWPTSGAGRAAK